MNHSLDHNHDSREEHWTEEDNASQLTLPVILSMVHERWLVGVIAGLILAALTAFVLLKEPKVYETFAELYVQDQGVNIIEIEGVVPHELGHRVEAVLQRHQKRMQEPAYREWIIENKLTPAQRDRLFESYIFSGDDKPDQESALNAIVFVSVRRQLNDQYFEVVAQHHDPEMCALIANVFNENYDEYVKRDTTAVKEGGLKHLEEEVSSLKAQADLASKALGEFRKEHQLTAVEEENSPQAAKAQNLGLQIAELDVKIENYETELQLVDKFRREGRLAELSFISSGEGKEGTSGVLEALDENKQEWIALDEVFLENHPKMKANLAQRDALEKRLSAAVNVAVEQLKTRLPRAREKRVNLQNQLKGAEVEMVEVAGLTEEYKLLLEKSNAATHAYRLTLDRYKEVEIANKLEDTNIQVTGVAVVPSTPVTPDTKRAVILACSLFSLAFLGLPIGLGLIDSRIKSVSELEAVLGAECLGVIPDRKKTTEGTIASSVYFQEDDKTIESFRAIYSSMILSSTVPLPKVVMVTSSVASEGKSSITSNLAAMAERHDLSVLVMDCDFRKPSQDRHLGLKNDKGLLTWYHSDDPVPQTAQEIVESGSLGINQVDSSGLFVMCSGGTSKNPTEVIQNGRFEELMAVLRKSFDLIIVDTPPIGIIADAVFLGMHADESIFVCQHNAVNRQKVQFAFNKLQKSGCRLIGLIMNRMANARRYQYYYTDYGYNSAADKKYEAYYAAEDTHGSK